MCALTIFDINSLDGHSLMTRQGFFPSRLRILFFFAPTSLLPEKKKNKVEESDKEKQEQHPFGAVVLYPLLWRYA